MSIFKNLTHAGLEETQDRTGGGFGAVEAGLYTGTIKLAYAGKSSGGAHNITLVVALENGREYTETIYITNKAGDNFYVKGDKKFPLPGFTTMDDICLVTSGKGLAEQDTEEKVVKIYDFDAGAELPKSVQALTDIMGQQVTLGILKTLTTKMQKDGNGAYTIPTDETREENSTDKVFHSASMMTTVEARQGKTVGEFHTVWDEKNTGKTRDKTYKGNPGQAGSTVKAGMPPMAGAAQSAKKPSLFGPKG